MITKLTARRVRACSVLMFGIATMPTWAQNSQTPAPTPTLIPGLEHFSLPPGPGTQSTRPTLPPPVVRTVPTPTPSPTPTPIRTPAASRPTATPRATPTQSVPPPLVQPRAVPSSAPVAPPTPAPTEAPAPEPLPPVAEPPPIEPLPPAPAASPEPEMDHGYRLTGWQAIAAIAGGAATLFLLGWLTFLYLRRRDEVLDEGEPERRAHATFDLRATDWPPVVPTPSEPSPPPPSPPPASSAAPPPPPSPPPPPPPPPPSPSFLSPTAMASVRATLDIEFKPKRAGTNLLSAAVEYEISVANSGETAARAVKADVRISSAGAEQDAILRALFAGPIEKPATVPFDLPPGQTATLGGMAMMPKETLSVMTVEGRALFVPVLAINLLYEWDGGSGQTATSYVIGIDRGEGAKLAPFRLDGASRMRDDISRIPYTVSVRR